MANQYFVYILANGLRGTLYVGVTSDLKRRVWEHKEKVVSGFTAKHGIDQLVYFETFGDVELAIRREKRLKRWNRAWKIDAIEETNPQWVDLYPTL